MARTVPQVSSWCLLCEDVSWAGLAGYGGEKTIRSQTIEPRELERAHRPRCSLLPTEVDPDMSNSCVGHSLGTTVCPLCERLGMCV